MKGIRLIEKTIQPIFSKARFIIKWFLFKLKSYLLRIIQLLVSVRLVSHHEILEQRDKPLLNILKFLHDTVFPHVMINTSDNHPN